LNDFTSPPNAPWEPPEHLVEVAAQAMYKGQVEQVRSRVANCNLQLERIRDVISTAFSDSDRSAAILIFALIEDLMIDFMQLHLNKNITGGWNDVIGGNGLLASANDRMTFLYLLYWISPQTYKNLKLLKSIRNRFAHRSDVKSFGEQKIASWITELEDVESKMRAVIEVQGYWRELDYRERYLARSAHVLTSLAAELAVGPYARAARVDPLDVFGGFDDALPNIKKAQLLGAEFVLRVYLRGH
jgi:hypothetical protein